MIHEQPTCAKCRNFEPFARECRVNPRKICTVSALDDICSRFVDKETGNNGGENIPSSQQPTEKYSTEPATKVCKECGRELPVEEFQKNPKNPEKRIGVCKECMRRKRMNGFAKVYKKINPSAEDDVPCNLMPSALSLEQFSDQQLADELTRRGWCGKLELRRSLYFNVETE